MNKITRLLAVAGISGALAVGAAGVAQASPDRGVQRGPDQVSKVDRSGSSRDHSSNDHGKNHDHGKKHDHGKNHK